jgi:hypothetical protein
VKLGPDWRRTGQHRIIRRPSLDVQEHLTGKQSFVGVLQQEWKNSKTGKVYWVDIPVVSREVKK